MSCLAPCAVCWVVAAARLNTHNERQAVCHALKDWNIAKVAEHPSSVCWDLQRSGCSQACIQQALPQGAQGKCAAVCKRHEQVGEKKERATNSIVAISAQEGPLGADPERIVTIQLYRQKRHCFSN